MRVLHSHNMFFACALLFSACGMEQVKNPHVTASMGDSMISFSSYGKAADWVITELLPKNTVITLGTKSNISNRIAQAVANGSTYHGYTWSSPVKSDK